MDMEIELVRQIGEAVASQTDSTERSRALRRLIEQAIRAEALQKEQDFGEGWRLEDTEGHSILPQAMKGLAFAASELAWHYWDAVGRPGNTQLLRFEFMDDIRYYTTPPEMEEE